jgi:UDP-4-amino-4,6-dideoxy-N-acetyl-beta-L-altrosamine transaminase
MIPYGRQEVTDSDIESVVRVLRSDFLTQGPEVPAFEREICAKFGSNYAAATNSATSALHIACLALNLRSGDSLWTSPISFVASANCGLYCGASIDFVDIDRQTYNISIPALRSKLAEAERMKRLPKVLVVVHMCGQPCAMREIKLLSDKYGFKIIEDASHAIGSKYDNEFVGNCRYSDITIFSFHPVKIITAAEGGIALTNDRALYKQMETLRSHGITRDVTQYESEIQYEWYYEQQHLGFNYRMTDMQAALARSQLQRLEDYVEKRRALAKRYSSELGELDLGLPIEIDECQSSYHLYVVKVPSMHRDDVFQGMRASGIGVNVHYIPIYRQPYYKKFNYTYKDYPESEYYYRHAITLPLYPSLTTSAQDMIIQKFKELLK